MENLKERKVFASLLGLSVVFFIFKGVRYLLIGSYLPLTVFSLMVLGLTLLVYKNDRHGKIVVRIWSAFLLLWSLARLVLPLLFYLTPQITESHIREQFTPLELTISLLFLTLGVYLWRYVKQAVVVGQHQ